MNGIDGRVFFAAEGADLADALYQLAWELHYTDDFPAAAMRRADVVRGLLNRIADAEANTPNAEPTLYARGTREWEQLDYLVRQMQRSPASDEVNAMVSSLPKGGPAPNRHGQNLAIFGGTVAAMAIAAVLWGQPKRNRRRRRRGR